MDKLDNLTLLSNDPIDFYGIPIYKPTLKEIASIGQNAFNRATSLLVLSDIEIEQMFIQNDLPVTELEPFRFLLDSCQNQAFFLELNFAFFTYLKKEIIVVPEGFSVKIANQCFVINRQNFPEFQNIIRQINRIYDADSEQEIITDNLAMKKKFLAKRKMLQKAKLKAKAKATASGETISLDNMISSLCVYNIGYTMQNIWELTIYQLYDQFLKCQKKESYEISIQSLLAGGDSKKIKPKYWIKN